MMRTHIYRFALVMLCLSALMACRRNEAPQRRSNSSSTVDHLIIKEVFYTGHAYSKKIATANPPTTTQSWYEDDTYITIYNPTSETKYLDGLALCSTVLDPSTDLTFEGNSDFRNQYLGVASISYFPGKGTDYPIKPGQEVVIAKYALNHATDFFERLDKTLKEYGEEPEDHKLYSGVDAFLDLSKVNWEWTNINNDTEHKNSSKVSDLVPIFTKESDDEDLDFGFKNVTETSGIALIKLPWTPEDFAKNYKDTEGHRGYRHHIKARSTHHHKDIDVIEIPFDKVLDCITICPKSEYKINPYSKNPKNSIERGYHAVSDGAYKNTPSRDWGKYSGMSLIRKWDGKKFVDDNNSTSDFEVKPASLGVKK